MKRSGHQRTFSQADIDKEPPVTPLANANGTNPFTEAAANKPSLPIPNVPSTPLANAPPLSLPIPNAPSSTTSTTSTTQVLPVPNAPPPLKVLPSLNINIGAPTPTHGISHTPRNGPPVFQPQLPNILPNITLPASPTNAPPQFSTQPRQNPTNGTIQHNQAEFATYQALQQGVALQRQQIAASKAYNTQQTDNLTSTIPNVFVSSSTPPPINQNKDQVFLCGPVGASQKKEFKPRWAVLFRDRLDLFSKYGDAKPTVSFSLQGCLVQSNKDGADSRPYISITNAKESLFLRAENPTKDNTPPTFTASSISPDLDNAHKGWLNSIKFRTANCQYLVKCKEMGISHPDERLLQLYDAQYKAPFSMQLIATYCPSELYQKLPQVPAIYIHQIGKHPSTDLPYEGYCLDLAGRAMLDSLPSLAAMLNDPDALPIVGLKLEGAEIDLKATEEVLLSLAFNSNSQLVQLDLSGAKCLDNANNAPANEELIELLVKFLTSQQLKSFKYLYMRSSNLTGKFMNAFSLGLQSATKQIIAPISVFDLSSNQLGDDSLPSLIGFMAHSEVLSNSLEYLNLSWNLFTDLDQLSTWLTLHKPTSSNYTLYQQTSAPFKPIRLQGLYLQGCSSLTDVSFVKLAKSIIYHLSLRVLDLSQCLRLHDVGQAAITKALQINESIEIARYGNYKLTLQGLTALRLFYRFGSAEQNTDLFGNDYSQFTLVGFASDA
jgi:hypothetical protein